MYSSQDNDPNNQHDQFVITSYSIHYTKLYDAVDVNVILIHVCCFDRCIKVLTLRNKDKYDDDRIERRTTTGFFESCCFMQPGREKPGSDTEKVDSVGAFKR